MLPLRPSFRRLLVTFMSMSILASSTLSQDTVLDQQLETIEIRCDEKCKWMDEDLPEANNYTDLMTLVPDLKGVEPAIFNPESDDAYFPEDYAASEVRRKRNIFGHDTRFSLSLSKYSEVYPFSTVVHFSVGCSGTLISPRHVLTAASCFHDGRRFKKGSRRSMVGRYAEERDEREGYAGRDPRTNTENRMVWTSIVKINLPRMWIQRSLTARGAQLRRRVRQAPTPGHNFAVVTLKDKLGPHSMPLGIAPIRPKSKQRLHFSAFNFQIDSRVPKKLAKSVQMKTSERARLLYRWCDVEKQNSHFLYHHCDAVDTALGAGIYMSIYNVTSRKSVRQIVGVFTGSRPVRQQGAAGSYQTIINQSTRMTPFKRAQICFWVYGNRANCYQGRGPRTRKVAVRPNFSRPPTRYRQRPHHQLTNNAARRRAT